MRRWTPEEDRILIERYRKGVPIKRIKEELGRETSSIADRLERLQSKGLVTRDRGNKANKIRTTGAVVKVYLTHELHKKVRARAAADGTHVTRVIRRLLAQMLL